ncbi:MAG: DUF1647 domain-containing protein [Candidatus Puniceispirillum sp.]|nr:DUF1647 domain-containing protein [Candidatus Puniceispirillum sp.]
MIKKLLSSDKVKRLKKSTINFPKYVYDYGLVFIGLVFNLLKYRKFYQKNLTIVTGSDSIFFDSLLQLVENIKKYESSSNLIVYDLGMETEQIEKFKQKFPEIVLKPFEFTQYPEFVGKRDEHNKLGHYAWKSAILSKEISIHSGLVLWFDAGNLINKKLNYLRIALTAFGFYSPHSDGKISDWTHQGTIDYLSVKKNILKKSNLTGGLVGVDTSNNNAVKLIKNWEKFSLNQECIAPEGSSRDNHRQDQSILSILKHQNEQKIFSPKMKLNFGIKVNQNPGIKIYLSDSFENESKRKIKDDWLKKNFNISVNTIKQSNIIWILDIDDLKRIPKKLLKSKILIFVIFNDDNISVVKLKNILKVFKKEDFIFLQNEFNDSSSIIKLVKNQNLKQFSTMQDVESHIKELITN